MRGFLSVVFTAFSMLPLEFVVGQEWSQPQSVAFNQDWLEQTWKSQRPIDPIPRLVVDDMTTDRLDPTDRVAVIRYLLTQIPESAVVYPSERDYYFKFWCGHRLISGNLRFCDVEKGQVHFGYFDEFDSQFLYTGTIDDGLNGSVLLNGNDVELKFSGISKTFRLDRSWQDSSELKLSDNESLVSGILDESGYCFWLVYNQSKRRLYFVLNESRNPENAVAVTSGGVRFLIGQISRFVFYVDETTDRKILVGVYEDNIRKNNYFDGPFDQVPPDLNIKSMLEEVYPYVKDRGGIDEHGNFVALHHSRVAISPYVKYTDTSSFLVFAAQVLKPKLKDDLAYSDLVYESKMDFHLLVRGTQAAKEEIDKEPSETRKDLNMEKLQ